MGAPPPSTARFQFSLLELVVGTLVVGALLGFLILMVIPGFSHGRPRLSLTASLKHELSLALDNYRTDCGTYPIRHEGTVDSKTLLSRPRDYFNTLCSTLGSPSLGSEDNSSLISILIKHRCLDPKKIKIDSQTGNLVDEFGTPFVVRFLWIPGESSETKIVIHEKVYIWSYGKDKINAVNATPHYVNQGGPEYDKAEAERIEASPAAGADDITSWR